MKFLLSWLKEFIELSLPPPTLAERLTLVGLEVHSLSEVDGDWLFEAEVTPNRPDLLSHLGIARETAAALGRTFRFPRWLQRELRVPVLTGEPISVRVEDPESCPLYAGLVLEGVRVAPSPAEWVHRLNKLGIRSVNNVVDITNLCLFELGQPIHAFDLDLLEGRSVSVRKARAGENLETLDSVKRTLPPGTLVIADARKPVALAGVMGGKNTEITSSTRRIFLESACFKPAVIRRSVRMAKAASDSSYRFERGVDSEMVSLAAMRAARWITRVAGGTIRSMTEVRSPQPSRRAILLKPRQAEAILGMRMSSAQQKKFLEHLGCSVRGSGRGWRVEPPSWREDLRIPEDLYEELARLFGYDRCPTSLPPLPRRSMKEWETPEDPRIERERGIRRMLVAAGCQEIQTYSLLGPELLARGGLHPKTRPPLRIRNPLSAEQSFLRPGLLSGALSTLSLNLRRKATGSFQLFEIGKIFDPSQDIPRSEKKQLSLLAAGVPEPEWGAERIPLDLFHLKGIAQAISQRNGGGFLLEKEETVPACLPGMALVFFSGSERWGWAGLISPEILSAFEIPADLKVAYAEFDLEKILATPIPELRIIPPARFPAVVRDLALVIPQNIRYRDLQEAVLETGRPLLREAVLFDLYHGKQVPSGKKGLAFRLSFSDPERTLTEDEVTTSVHRILKSLQDRFQAMLRSS